jgi:hypothetical protein
MAADYQITVEGDIVFITLNRNLNYQAMCSLWDNIVSDYSCSKRLWDLTLFTSVPSMEELTKFAIRGLTDETERPESYTALVAPTDLLFGVMRQYQVYRERNKNTTIQVHRTVEEALIWLKNL